MYPILFTLYLKRLMILFTYYTSLKLKKKLENLYSISKHANDFYLQVFTNILQYSLVSLVISIQKHEIYSQILISEEIFYC